MSLEKTDQAVSESIQLFNDFTQKGIDFIQQQSPELCEQIVNKALFQYITLSFFWLIITTILFIMTKLWQRSTIKRECFLATKKNPYIGDPEYIISTVAHYLSLIPLFVGGFTCLYKYISIYIAPKVYLVEYFTQLN